MKISIEVSYESTVTFEPFRPGRLKSDTNFVFFFVKCRIVRKFRFDALHAVNLNLRTILKVVWYLLHNFDFENGKLMHSF